MPPPSQPLRPAAASIASAAPMPLVLAPILMPKVWGGRRLESVGKALPERQAIGESWELADLPSTSAGGGGGAAARSIIASGPLAGATLHDALDAWGPKLLGRVRPTPAGDFPLLVKFLDAREHLSVQVHPSPAYCRAHPEAHLKTECWHILAAEPGSVIFKGVKPGVTRADFERALREPGAEGSGVVALMESCPAVVGECHTLPSGTVHALGAGVLVAEVQTPSDTTFRVYDWAKEYGRAGRELHVEQSLECIAWERARDGVRRPPGHNAATLVSTGYFDVDEIGLRAGEGFALRESPAGADAARTNDRPQVIMVLGGAGALISTRGAFADQPIARGQTALVPACEADATHFRAAEDATLLRAVVR